MTCIRRYQPDDAPALRELLTEIWGSDPWTVHDYSSGLKADGDPDRVSHTWAAEDNGAVVGFGSAWANPFHPHARYIGIHVHLRC